MKNQDYLLLALGIVFLSCGTSKIKSGSADAIEEITSTKNYMANYEIVDGKFGNKTYVKIEGNNRVMKTNALPNHATGSFPNSGNPNRISSQDMTYTIPLNPKLSGESKWAREPGVALNGVKFEPETAERFVCETGEVYRIEAFQDLVNLGLDFNHAHVQPTGAYHYHGVPTELVKILDNENDVVHVGFALDGFPIFYSKSGKYKSSFKLSTHKRSGDLCEYTTPKTSIKKDLKNTSPDGTFVSDWLFESGLGNLDECNGTMINGTYAYFVTDEYPYMGRCLKGVFIDNGPKGFPPRGERNGPPGRGNGNNRPQRGGGGPPNGGSGD